MTDFSVCEEYEPKTEIKTMNNTNRIEISYQETADGRVIITDFKMLSEEEITEMFGEEVASAYFKEAPFCCKDIIAICACDKYISIGKVITKNYFEEVIDQIREAGKRLSEIRKQVAAYETKTIII